jgi:hypothetical protein
MLCIYRCMHNNNITLWIQKTIESSNSDWILLTLRIDGMQVNASGVAQSPWNTSCAGGLSKVESSLNWTLGMLRRTRKQEIRFAGYHGGDYAIGIQPHIHAICEVPPNSTSTDLLESLQLYWQQSVERRFKVYLPTSVYQDKLMSSNDYLRYISRYEGKIFGYGDSKLILNRSFKF